MRDSFYPDHTAAVRDDGQHPCPWCRADEMASAVAQFHARHVAASLDLLAAVLPDPAAATPIALAAGVRADLFPDDDLRAVWGACEFAHAGGRDAVLRLARESLISGHAWDATQIADNHGSMLWSDARLRLLAAPSPCFPLAVRFCAWRLRDLDARVRRAGRLLRRAHGRAEAVLLGHFRAGRGAGWRSGGRQDSNAPAVTVTVRRRKTRKVRGRERGAA